MSSAPTTADHPPAARFCSYPQGDRSILPTLVTWMAVISALLALNVLPSSTISPRNFLCFEAHLINYSGGSNNNSGNFVFTPEGRSMCDPLSFYSRNFSYYDETMRRVRRIAAACGIVSAIVGVLAAAKLSTAACFVLSGNTLRRILWMQSIAATLALLTLVAAFSVFDPDEVCGFLQDRNAVSYQEYGYRCDAESSSKMLDEGAIAMLVSATLYVVSAVMIAKDFREETKTATTMTTKVQTQLEECRNPNAPASDAEIAL